MLMFYIHENRAIILAIKTRKPLETLAVFGVQSFRPHVLAEDEGFDLIKVALRRAVARGARPRRI